MHQFQMRIILFLACLLWLTSNARAQIEDLLPIMSNPHVLLNSKGEKVLTLPPGERIINSLKGEHVIGWAEGMADIEIGTCGHIVTINSLYIIEIIF